MQIPTDLVFKLVTLTLALMSALLAGVFFSFSSFVMGALDRLGPIERVQAMLNINSVVLNWSFLGLFFASAVLSVILLLMLSMVSLPDGSMFLLGAGAALALAGFLITVTCNVPLNEMLARDHQNGLSPEASWAAFFSPWMIWNHLRGAAFFGSAFALVLDVV